MGDDAAVGYWMVDVYREGFLLRRETLGARPGTVVIGSSPEARIWLDSQRVDPAHAVLEVDGRGRVVVEDRSIAGTWMGRRRVAREELFCGAPLTIPPFLLVVAKRPNDPDPSTPPRVYPAPPRPPRPVAPDPAPPPRSCPRCAVALVTTVLPSTGPAYRSAPAEALACPRCGACLVAAADLAARIALPGRVSDSAAVRSRASARGLCPTCRSDLQELTLSWADTWLVLEECGGCGLVVLDARELEALVRIARALAGG